MFCTSFNKECKLQIEREKADLSVQVIQLSERLEEAEGGAESQASISIKSFRLRKVILNITSLILVRNQ